MSQKSLMCKQTCPQSNQVEGDLLICIFHNCSEFTFLAVSDKIIPAVNSAIESVIVCVYM